MMKKGKKRVGIVLLLSTLLAMSVTGCGSSSSYKGNDSFATTTESSWDSGYYPEAPMEDYAEEAFSGSSSVSTSAGDATAANADLARKLIRNVDMSVETKEYDALLEALEVQVAAAGGYIESSYSWNGSTYSGYRVARTANMTIRIPSNRLDSFLNQISGISNVIRKTESVSDITLQYVDVASHKEALRTEQDRLLELLSVAEDLESILIIEDRLADVRYQLQSYESQLRTYDNQVNYSTVVLDIEEVAELTKVDPEPEKNAFQKMGEGFVENLIDVWDGFVNFCIWFVSNIPNLIVWALVIWLLVVIIKKIRKSQKMKQDRNEEAGQRSKQKRSFLRRKTKKQAQEFPVQEQQLAQGQALTQEQQKQEQ